MTKEQNIANTEEVVLEDKPKKAKSRKKSKDAKRQVSKGCAYIKTSYNNTIVSLTDMNGNVIAWSSSGNRGFAGAKKSTPYAATQVVRDAAEKAKPYGLREVFVYLRGVGSGRESAIRTLNAAGYIITGIKDITPIPHNGPRAPKPRRI